MIRAVILFSIFGLLPCFVYCQEAATNYSAVNLKSDMWSMRAMRASRIYFDKHSGEGIIVPRRFYRRTVKFKVLSNELGYKKITYGPRKKPYRYVGTANYEGQPWLFGDREPPNNMYKDFKVLIVNIAKDDTLMDKQPGNVYWMRFEKDYYLNMFLILNNFIRNDINVIDRRKKVVIAYPKKKGGLKLQATE